MSDSTREFSFSCYEFFRGIFLLSVVSFRFFTQHGGENNGELLARSRPVIEIFSEDCRAIPRG